MRRLLENGANSSFVHQLTDESVDVDALLASPVHPASAPSQPLPLALYGWNGTTGRKNSAGVDLAVIAERAPLERAVATTAVDPLAEAGAAQVEAAMVRLAGGYPRWNATPLAARVNSFASGKVRC